MRSLILKTVGVVIAVFMALGLLAAPSASAQTTYPPVPPTTGFGGASAGPTGDAILAAIQAQRAAAAAAAAEAAAAAAAQQAGQADGTRALALTGGDVQLPIVIGASLVGAGGLALLAARKRNNKL